MHLSLSKWPVVYIPINFEAIFYKRLKMKQLLSLFLLINIVNSLPNILIFLADDLGYGDIGCFGNNTIKTPNIDNLANNGIKLNHHLAAAAVCTPSRAALLTGRYPIRSGMESSHKNKVFFFVAASGGLPENETTFAKALKQKSYTTALIGKWHLGNDCQYKGDGCHHPLNHGFDYFYGLPLTNLKDFGDDGKSVITSYVPNLVRYIISLPIFALTILIFFNRKLNLFSVFLLLFFVAIPAALLMFIMNINVINGIVMENSQVVEQPVRLKGLTQRFVQKAKLFLENQSKTGNPFLLYVSFVHVHTALFCADEFVGKSKHGPFGDNIQEMDWAVGEVTNTLKELGMQEETFIYFSSDNGGHIEEVGISGQREGGHNGVLRGGKAMGGMEGGIRVPSIISWPNASFKGEINVTTSQMDLFPTLMELTGISLPEDRIIDGKSLMPLLKSNTRSPHQFLFHYCGKQIHAATFVQRKYSKVWKIHWTTPKFVPGTSQCEYICQCIGDFVIHHNPPLLYDLTNDISESRPIDIASNSFARDIIAETEVMRYEHTKSIDTVPDQFSFENSVWKPWLQPWHYSPYF